MTRNKLKPKGPGRPSNPLGKEALLDIARYLFAQKGYEATSMMSIAEAAGISKASVFHHYPSKEQLYLAALDTILRDMGLFIEKATTMTGSLTARLDGLTDAVVDYFAAHPQGAKLLLFELMSEGPFLKSGGEEIVQMVMQQAVLFIEQAGDHNRERVVQKAMSVFGMHLLYFAVSNVVSRFKGTDIFSKEEVEKRKTALRLQVRQIVLEK